MSLKQELQQNENTAASVGIDMPVLDQADEHEQQLQHQQKQEESLEQHDDGQGNTTGPPVSMPSLDDDGDSSSHPSNTEHIPMDLEEMQNAAESGQIKFILNEDGQILQLDNHIITTDADGNQILVQGTDSEQIQQLLQSVGVLQAGEGDGETFQMIQGENNQMIIVQGDNNEAQLIDASMLNEDGHLVIQQQDGDEMGEEMHVVNEDGVQVPVSIAYATSGDDQHHQHLDAEQQQQLNEEQQQQEHELQQQMDEQNEIGDDQQQQQHDENSASAESVSAVNITEVPTTEQQHLETSELTTVTTEATSTTQPVTSTTGDQVFFNLEDLMPEQKVNTYLW